jgi:protease I
VQAPAALRRAGPAVRRADGVTAALASPADFVSGPWALRRDAPTRLDAGFTVLDGRDLSARWPGDAHRFAHDDLNLLDQAPRSC